VRLAKSVPNAAKLAEKGAPPAAMVGFVDEAGESLSVFGESRRFSYNPGRQFDHPQCHLPVCHNELVDLSYRMRHGLSTDTIELYERHMIDELALRLVHGSYR
jgi:hypothetical protein